MAKNGWPHPTQMKGFNEEIHRFYANASNTQNQKIARPYGSKASPTSRRKLETMFPTPAWLKKPWIYWQRHAVPTQGPLKRVAGFPTALPTYSSSTWSLSISMSHNPSKHRKKNVWQPTAPLMAPRQILPSIMNWIGRDLCFDRRNPSVLRHAGRLQLCDWPWRIYLLGFPLHGKRWTQTKGSSTKSRFLLIHRLYANASSTQNKKSHGLVPRIRRIAPFGTHFVSGTFFTYRIHTLWLWEMNRLFPWRFSLAICTHFCSWTCTALLRHQAWRFPEIPQQRTMLYTFAFGIKVTIILTYSLIKNLFPWQCILDATHHTGNPSETLTKLIPGEIKSFKGRQQHWTMLRSQHAKHWKTMCNRNTQDLARVCLCHSTFCHL